jgi:signal transduction histidine kinase
MKVSGGFAGNQLMATLDIRDEHAQSAQVEFLAGITHDLKTPLATIATSAELLEQDLEPGASNHLISIIQRQAERLQTLVQDLSDYFRYEMGTIILHPQTIDLTDLVRVFCVEFQESDPDHKLDVLLPASSVLVDVDPSKVRRILENLLRNAFKYTPAGTAVRATLRVDAPEKNVTIEIEDEGKGIPEESRIAVFSPYVRLDTTKGRGEGLGLSIVKQLAEAHGGQVWVENGSAGGARFCVQLPFQFQPRADLSSG